MRLRGTALFYILVEDLLVLGSLVAAFAFSHSGNLRRLATPEGLIQAVVLLLGFKVVFFICGLYDLRQLPNRPGFWTRLFGSVVLVALGSLAVGAVLMRDAVAAAAFLLAAVPLVVLGRTMYELVSRCDGFRQRLLFLGIGTQAARTAREILQLRNRDFEIVGFLAPRRDDLGWRIGGSPVLGTYEDLQEIAIRERVDRVVVAVEDRRKQLPMEALLSLRIHGVEILEEARVHEEIAGKIPVEDLRPSWLIFSEGFRTNRLRQWTKRGFDVFFATLGLVLSAPLSAIVAVAIRLESRGPVIFRQRRVGQGGEEFTLLKFRSMRADAERGGEPQWARRNDPRVTRVGRFIRKTRLDEIPQMWNVLRGDMSFVGPRPERLFFVERLRREIPFYDQRHAVKPGITGWAQVRFRYGADESDAIEKLRRDMFYIKHHSILLDLRILLETVRVVFERDKGR